jgi:hypothetical protein
VFRCVRATSFGLPADDYGLLELYCNDDNCDCQRVMFNVLSRKQEKSVAVVAFGWETATFYQKMVWQR